MANCLFPAGIEKVSGTLSKSTIVTSKGVITKRRGSSAAYLRILFIRQLYAGIQVSSWRRT